MASPEAMEEAPAAEERTVKSCKRTCTTCGYSWIDKYAKADCPKCFSPMTDGYTFMDTALGQAMAKAMEEVQKKQKAEEKRNWASIRACVERGEEKSRLEWEHFRSRSSRRRPRAPSRRASPRRTSRRSTP